MKKSALLFIFALSALMLAFSAAPAHAMATTPLNLGSCGFVLLGSWDTNTNTCTLNSAVGYSSTLGFSSEALQIPSGTTLTIESGNSLDAFWGIVNNGTINNYGETSNEGVTGITLEGANLYNSGVLNNYGDIYLQTNTLGVCIQSGAFCYPTLENDNGGVVNNEGSILAVYNNCQGYNCGNAGQVTNKAGGDFTNSGTIILTQYSGVCADSPDGGDCFANLGTYRTILNGATCVSLPLSQSWDGGSSTCTIGSDNTVTLGSGESIIVPAGITLAVDGTLANNGEIDNQGAIFVSGAISPFGVVTNTDGSTVTFVLGSSLCTGTLGGTWSSDTCTLGRGVTNTFDSAYILQLGGGVSLNNQGTLAITLNLFSGSAFTNSGTFTSQNLMDNFGTITNSGSFDNTASAEIQDVGPISNSGTLTNEGLISLTCIDSPEGSGCGTLVNSGTVTNSGTITGYSFSMTEFCVATFSGNPPTAGAFRNIPCAPVITTTSGQLSLSGSVTISGTENLASNSGSPTTIYVSYYSSPAGGDEIASTTTDSTGGWSVSVPLSLGTNTLYAFANSEGISFGSEYGSSASNAVTATFDNSLDQTTCQSAIGGNWISQTNTCTNSGLFSLQSSDSLTIGSGTTLVNQASGELTNHGSLTIQGTVTNEGAITNRAGGTITDAGTISNTGTITNSGTFTVNLNSATCESYPLDGSWSYVAPFSTCTILSGTSVMIPAGMALDLSNGQVLYNSGTITNSGTISLSEAAFYDNACKGTLTGNAISGTGTIEYAPCAPTITTSDGVFLTGSLSVSGTSDLASNGGNAMTITLYSGSNAIGSTTTTTNGAWTITASIPPGIYTLDATATSSANIASPPSSQITVTFQYLDQASCQSPVGGTWSSSTPNECTVDGSYVLPEPDGLEVPSGTTLLISTSGSFNNDGTLTDLGTITNSGSFSNQITLVGDEPQGGSLSVSGTLTNSGMFSNDGQVTIDSGGTFTNYAQMTDASIPSTTVHGGGLLSVAAGGIFDNSAGATLTNQQDSLVENSGTLNNNGEFDNAQFTNVENNLGGTFSNAGTMTLESTLLQNSGTFTNTGALKMNSAGDEVAELQTYEGEFYNYGAINLLGAGSVDLQSPFVNEAGATITNEFGFVVDNGGSLFNHGTFVNSPGSGGGGQFSGELTVVTSLANYGTIDNHYQIVNGGTLTNSGTITDFCGSSISGNSVPGIVSQTCSAEDSGTTTTSGGGASSDQTSNTGIGVTISGSTAPDGASVTIYTEDLISPNTNVAVGGLASAAYYDVSIVGVSDGTAQVCVTTTQGPSGLAMQYWDGSEWDSALSITVSGSTICGDIPVSALTGTNVVVGETIAQPTITTSPSSSAVTLGSIQMTLTDEATLSSGNNPTGTITFTLYAPGGVTPVDTETVTVIGNGAYVTPTGYTLPTTGAVTGNYQWDASYSGDVNNDPASGNNAQNEQVVVIPASPIIFTTPGGTILLSSTSPPLTDTATLTGGYHESGTITFTLVSPVGQVVDTETVTVSGDGTYTTPTGYTPYSAGTYQWEAAYSGDANNDPVNSAGGESETVAQASPSVSTSVSPTSIPFGGSAMDTATLTGGYHPTGTITFTVFSDNACKNSITSFAPTSVTVSGNGQESPSAPFTAPAVGSYYWQAMYSGDSNNNGFTTPCGATGESLTVNARSTALTISCTAAAVNEQTACNVKVTDTDVGAPITPTGTVGTFSDGTKGGTFGPNSCTLSSGSCTFGYTPPSGSAGTVIPISATYEGDSIHLTSTGSASLAVSPYSVSCAPSAVQGPPGPQVAFPYSCTASTDDFNNGPPPVTAAFTSSSGSFQPPNAACPSRSPRVLHRPVF